MLVDVHQLGDKETAPLWLTLPRITLTQFCLILATYPFYHKKHLFTLNRNTIKGLSKRVPEQRSHGVGAHQVAKIHSCKSEHAA